MQDVLVIAIVWGAVGPLLIDFARTGRSWAAPCGMAVGLTLVLLALNHVGEGFGMHQLGVWFGAALVLGLGFYASVAAPPHN